MFLAAAVSSGVSASLCCMWGRESGLNSDTIDFHVVENFLIFLEYMFLCLLFTLRTVSKGFNCCVLKQLSPVSLGSESMELFLLSHRYP